MAHNRVPLQVAPIFKKKLDELYGKILLSGKKKSYRELTEEIVLSQHFKDIENQILNPSDLRFDVKLRLDRRIL